MKKLMTMLAAIAFATVLQAATVNWSVVNVQSSPVNNAAAGWIVQLYDSSTTFSYADAKAGGITPWTSGATVAAGSTTVTYRANGSTTMDNGTTKSVYAVIYDATSIADAKYYIVSDAITLSANAAGSPVTAAFGSMSATAATNKFLNSSWTAVPEPTSGLLMLLGMAGLALKRKRA